MRDPAVNAKVEEAIAGAVRTLQGPAKAGYFKPCRLDPVEVAERHNARLYVMADHAIRPQMRALILRRLTGREPLPRRPGRYAGDEFRIRNAIIVGAIERAHKRGFDPIRNDASRTNRTSVSACSIVHTALKRLGVTGLSERRIEEIWGYRKKSRVRGP
jgi:plasmid stabilization system protein ParE